MIWQQSNTMAVHPMPSRLFFKQATNSVYVPVTSNHKLFMANQKYVMFCWGGGENRQEIWKHSILYCTEVLLVNVVYITCHLFDDDYLWHVEWKSMYAEICLINIVITRLTWNGLNSSLLDGNNNVCTQSGVWRITSNLNWTLLPVTLTGHCTCFSMQNLIKFLPYHYIHAHNYTLKFSKYM